VILDSSVIVAIALREPGYEKLVAKLQSAETTGIGTPTLTEAGMVLSARLGVEPQALDRANHPLLFVGDDFPRTDLELA
jgi:uncharacterized protein with PIN domain